MITDLRILDKTIEDNRQHSVVNAFFKTRSSNLKPSLDELKALIILIDKKSILEEYDFFLHVYIHNNSDNNYCCLTSIRAKLKYYLQQGNDYNYLTDKVHEIDIEPILARFSTLSYLKSAYKVGKHHFPLRKKVINTSSIYLTYKRSLTRSFLIDNGINIDHLGSELIYSKPLSYWEYYLLKDIPSFISLTKESENHKFYKLPWEKAHIIYSLLRCTWKCYICSDTKSMFKNLNWHSC